MIMQSRAPGLVVAAARHAFSEHTRPAGRRVTLVFDSVRDDVPAETSPRLLMFTGDTFDLIVTVAQTPRGKAIGGAIISGSKLTVAIRRPLRATIAIPVDDSGVLAETVIPDGTVRVIVDDLTGEAYQSQWFTL
jgi:hypothetical protein